MRRAFLLVEKMIQMHSSGELSLSLFAYGKEVPLEWHVV